MTAFKEWWAGTPAGGESQAQRNNPVQDLTENWGRVRVRDYLPDRGILSLVWMVRLYAECLDRDLHRSVSGIRDSKDQGINRRKWVNPNC